MPYEIDTLWQPNQEAASRENLGVTADRLVFDAELVLPSELLSEQKQQAAAMVITMMTDLYPEGVFGIVSAFNATSYDTANRSDFVTEISASGLLFDAVHHIGERATGDMTLLGYAGLRRAVRASHAIDTKDQVDNDWPSTVLLGETVQLGKNEVAYVADVHNGATRVSVQSVKALPSLRRADGTIRRLRRRPTVFLTD